MLSTTAFEDGKDAGVTAPLQGANFFRRSHRGLRYAGPRLFTRAPSGLSLFLLRMAKLQATPLVLAHSPLDTQGRLRQPWASRCNPLGVVAECSDGRPQIQATTIGTHAKI